ncbi:hypothetical protein HDU96_006907 [Phlyctochytrium bullatum]|nr:hypothetical protein HDU96_006907 [Phlyctochytrium bullatum]
MKTTASAAKSLKTYNSSETDCPVSGGRADAYLQMAVAGGQCREGPHDVQLNCIVLKYFALTGRDTKTMVSKCGTQKPSAATFTSSYTKPSDEMEPKAGDGLRQRKAATNDGGIADGSSAPAAAATAAAGHKKSSPLPLSPSFITDTGAMYMIPLAAGLAAGHSLINLLLCFAIQSLFFPLVAIAIYMPLFGTRFYYVWDVVYRRRHAATWKTEQSKTIDGLSWIGWILVLMLRKGSSFHLLLAITAGKAFVAIPFVIVANYWILWADRVGASDVSAIFQAMAEKFKQPDPTNTNHKELSAFMEREQLDQLDTTFHVGVPVVSTAFTDNAVLLRQGKVVLA